MKGQAWGNTGLGLAQWTAQKTGRTAWIILTTACVTLLPLYFEVHIAVIGICRFSWARCLIVYLEQSTVRLVCTVASTRSV